MELPAVIGLKERARVLEQKGKWKNALELYRTAIRMQEEAELPDAGLHNHTGDIQAKLGAIDEAVLDYTQAVDLYLEDELYNGAMAVCRKILRLIPARVDVHRKMGQIRGRQGLVEEARRHYETFCGGVDEREARKAMVEFEALSNGGATRGEPSSFSKLRGDRSFSAPLG